MLVLNQVVVPITGGRAELKAAAENELGGASVREVRILKKSVDARDKGKLRYVYKLAVSLENEEPFLKKGFSAYETVADTLSELLKGKKYKGRRPVIVGAGPSGLFAALALSYLGAKPLILERGERIEDRKATVKLFLDNQTLNCNSNVQFGEGGAGTFSDGKLTTGTSHPLIAAVLKEFVLSGAPEEILYWNKPHIGTDHLERVVKKMRERILSMGGEFLFSTTVEEILTANKKVTGVRTAKGDIETDTVYLAIGHSARDTLEMLCRKGVSMEKKPFSMGVRIEHLQDEIGLSQYGKDFRQLPPADYKLAAHLKNGRSLYTFCMCPGGTVINASSEEGGITVNGMSAYARSERNGNSAILVGVTPQDFPANSPLAGVEFQRMYERKAFALSGSHRPPVQLYGDFVKGKTGTRFGEIKPSVSTGYVFADLRSCLPSFVSEGISEGVALMARKLRGFDRRDAVLTGIESRSSSPVRILRDDKFQSSVLGLFPIGEGSGYAGGITSSAVDGLKAVFSSECICQN